MARAFNIPVPLDLAPRMGWVETPVGPLPEEQPSSVEVRENGEITLTVGSSLGEDAGSVSLRRLLLVLAREPFLRALMQEALDVTSSEHGPEQERALELQDELRGMQDRLVDLFRAGDHTGHGLEAFRALVGGLRLNAVAPTLGGARYTAWARLTDVWRVMGLPEAELSEWKRRAGHVETPG